MPTDTTIEAPATAQAPPDRADHTNALAAMSAVKFRIPGDVIVKTCESLPDKIRQAIKWAGGYCRARNLSPDEFGSMLKQPNSENTYSGDSIYQAFTGRRDFGSLERLGQSIEVLRRRVEETAPRADTSFVETALTRKIFAVCRHALARKRITFIFGPSQIGKTTAVAEYAKQNNHGETHLVRMPTRGVMGDFIQELALRLGISSRTKTWELRRRIMESFDDRTLLIIDECHQCLGSHYSDRALASLEFCREIWDRRKCGMVLVGTDVFKMGLRTNRVLRQLWLRGYRPLQLPAAPSETNLAEFATAFGLAPAPDRIIRVNYHDAEGDEKIATTNPLALQTGIVKDFGLGRWLSILEDAQESAKEAGSRISWGRVIVAHEQTRAMESNH